MNIQIEITTRCNFDCFYCAGRDMQQKDMPFDDYLGIMNTHLARYGVPRQVSLQGEGEPTLNKSFFKMAEHAARIGSEPFTITNGTYKYPEHFAEMFPSVGISVDTLDPAEAHNIGRYNLDRVLEFVDAIDKLTKVIIFTTVASPSSGGVAEWCRTRGFTHFVQPLQTKPDYQYRYPQQQQVTLHQPPKQFACKYLATDMFRYYAIDGVKMPCCFIKDTSQYVSIADLQQQLSLHKTPHSCQGCMHLK
jgi:MoaA/NifB/PqqE/SkfB family radical SAM enzyme